LKIYIITVCRNARTALSATIESVNRLRSGDVYYVIVDGNSTDGTKTLLVEAGPLIDLWVSEPDDGIYDAMNKGVSLLPHEDGHVLFLGAGDRLLELPTNQQREPGAVLFGNVQIRNSFFLSSAGWMLKASNTLHHQGIFVPRNILANWLFDTHYKIYADFDLNQRLLRANIPFKSLHLTIAFAQPGGVSWSSSHSEMVAISRKNFGFFWECVARVWAMYCGLRERLLGKAW
jgi:glycosyltransferase involved in cell wall biosynthesis